ncbi:hypothetical protein jhhlp_000514 [Lomentospora prolificans]|uniref:Cyclase n=1 Tax=Lomentospora prolificans TaxID=41688 RepID=A0A2N3NL51_9PEZI|nr:hypothetical protein jhhlp_000514 [Lomentospora prolificans]
MDSTKPAFDALPLRKDGPHGNAWGLYGSSDQCGTLNLLTPETIVAATREITDGTRVSTDLPLDYMSKPCFSRAPFQQTIKNKAPRIVNDDTLCFNTQSSSQWDGLRHYGYQEAKVYFNGRTPEEISNSKVNGISAWVEKGGIIGRGVLLDYASWADSKGIAIKAFESTSIPVSVLEEVAAHQSTELKPGDILLVRTGWLRSFEKLTEEGRVEVASITNPPAIGVESSEETLRWLWKKSFAAAGGDQPSFETWPCQDRRFFLHEWLLAGWGMPIGELFDLEALSAECQKRKKWSFFCSSVPLKVPGGVASPPNGVAIF